MNNKKLHLKIMLSAILLIAVNSSFAQTGPGGVGSAGGSAGQPENVLWLSADNLSLSDTDPVSSWADLSGNGNNLTQATGAAQPLYRTGQINGMPAIVFDGTDDFMPFDGNLISNSSYTVLFVGKRITNDGFRVFMGGTTSSANQNLHLYWANSSRFHAHHWGNDLQTDMVAAGTSYDGGTAENDFGIFASLLASSESSDQRRNYQNNHLLGSRDNNTQLSSYNGAAIGRFNSGFHDVAVAELILFSDALNDAQLQIVNQYLNVKYGINIDNDLYSPPAAYSYNLAGIGEESNGEHAAAASGGMYMNALSGLNAGDYLFVSHNNAANSSSDFTTADLPAGVELRYNREWYLNEINTPEAQIAFDFSEAVSDGLYPTDHTNYVLLFRATNSVNFSELKTADGVSDGDRVYFNLNSADFQDGYYTFATKNETDSPLRGAPGRVWYSLISGDWDNWETWTLDPSGTLPNNPDMYTPTSSPTSGADKVVILNGKTVSVNSAGKINAEIRVDGKLDINTTTGHNFGAIRGSGRILLQADNFPTGNASHFVTPGQGEGTVVYQGASYSLNTARTFFDVELSLNNSSETLTLTQDYQINGSLTIETGGLQINDATDDQKINLKIEKDLSVLTDGNISVGTGNPFASDAYAIGGTMPEDNGELYHDIYHQIYLKGDLSNHGIIKLTNQSNPEYGTLTTGGAATFRFIGEANTKASLNNATWFYNLVVDKGTDKTFVLELYAQSADDFVLFGANNVGRNTPTGFSSENPQVRKALFIKNGSLKFTGNVFIPTLSEGGNEGGNGDYAVGRNARFWVAGPGVQIYSTANDASEVTGFTPSGVNTSSSAQAMSVFGEFKISSGFFGTNNSAGFIFWADSNAQLKIEGGTANVSQVRAAGSAGIFSYLQSDGTLIVRGNETEAGEVSGDPLFEIVDPNGIFNMSGGEILMQDRGGSNVNGFYIPINEGNYNVTGGKLTVEIRSGNDFEIGSTAPVWDFEIKRLSGTGTSIVRLTDDFTVLDDLTINANCRLDVQDDADASTSNLEIGGDFNLRDSGEYLAHTNTTRFIGSGRSYIDIDNTTNPGELKFYNFEIHKDQRWNNDLFHRVELRSSGRAQDNHPLEILGNFDIVRGEFDYDEWEVDLKGNIEIVDGQILSSDASTPGHIVLNGTAQQSLKGSSSEEQEFGSYELDNSSGATLLSDINTSDFILTQGIMDLDIYNLEVSEAVSTTGTYSSSMMFQTAGNAGDGGISLYISGTGTYLYPVGTDANSTVRYTPLWLDVNTFTDDGYVQLSVADEDLPTALSPGGNVLSYYWRIRHSGFTSMPTVHYTFLADDSDDPHDDTDGDISIPSAVVGEVINESPYTRSNVDGDVNESNIGTVNQADDMYFYTMSRTLAEASYTCGKTTSFNGTLDVYYTTRVGIRDWDNQSKWSKTDNGVDDGNTGYPQAGDVAVIKTYGDNNQNAWVRGNMDISVGSLIFENGGGWNPRLWVTKRDAVLDLGTVSGSGEIYLEVTQAQTPTFTSSTDLGDFINEPASRFNFKIDSDNQTVDMPANIPVYPNIRIEAGDGNNDDNKRILRTSVPITVNGTVLMDRSSRWRINHDTEIGGDLRVTWQANRTTVEIGDDRQVNLYIGGDLRLENGNGNDGARFLVKNDNQNGYEHRIQVAGNIEFESNLNASSAFDLYNGPAPDNNAILELVGENDADFTNATEGGTEILPDLYRIVLNKGGTGSPAFEFNDNFTLNGPTDADPKAIELISGTLSLNDAEIDLMLTSGGADFKIPSASALLLWHGTLRASGNNTGIWLDGSMRVGYGSEWLLNEGTNNYIEYTASGLSEIAVYQGRLEVGSQIRRSEFSDEGILNFRHEHDNSTVIIGTDASIPENNRSTLEILNTGSKFTQVENTKIIIANAPQNNSAPAFYLDIDPADADIRTGSEIQFGNIDTQTGQEFSIFSSNNLQNLSTDNTASADLKASLHVLPLSLNENLTIAAGTEFDAKGKNLNIAGDFNNNGTFTASGNLTVFNGTANQNLNGASTFYDLDYISGNTLDINSPILVERDFRITQTAANVNDNGNSIIVLQDLSNSGTHIHGGTGDGIVMQGVNPQVIYGEGTYGKLTIDNSAGVELDATTNATVTITDVLKMAGGVFQIKGHLLTLTETCRIEDAEAFGTSNMIQTNLSFSDNGVKKTFPTGAGTFTFPIGSQGKYTPIDIIVSSNNSIGDLTVKAANERHPVIQEDSETSCQFTDVDNVLEYFWEMRANGFTDATGTVYFNYDTNDVAVNNTCGLTETDYITARILSDNSGNINKFTDVSTFDEAGTRLRFDFINTNDAEISGDYLAGLEEAIPDQIPIYETIANGSWTDGSIWTPNVAGGPRGAIAIVNPAHTVTVDNNGDIFSYITEINGRLEVNKTVLHRIGNVKGTGTIYMQHGDLPGGFYNEFISASGGTFEFGSIPAGEDYSVLSSLPVVNNLVFSGKGKRELPNLNLNILGELTIDGDDATMILTNEFDNTIKVQGDLTVNQGTFDAGTGSSAVFAFTGSQAQNVNGTGNLTGGNAFNHLLIENSTGVSLNIPADVDNNLLFNDGLITTSASSILTLENSSETCVIGESNTKFVDGPLRKFILASGNFDFPVGDNSRYGNVLASNVSNNGYYSAEYYNYNPLADAYNPNNFAAPLTTVSQNEYWRVNGPVGESANIVLRWDAASGVPSTSADRDELRVAEWSSSNSQWEQSHTDDTAVGSSTAGTVSATQSLIDLSGDHIFTIAGKVLRVNEWEGTVSADWNTSGNWSLGIVPDATHDVTVPADPLSDPNVFPVIGTAAEVRQLTIETSAEVEISPAQSLTLFGAFINNGVLRLKSPLNSNASASFIDNGSISGSGQIEAERFLSAGEFHYVSSPVQNASGGIYTDTNGSGNFNPNFYTYDESFDLDGNNATAPSLPFDSDNLVPGWTYAHGGSFGTADVMNPTTGYAFWSNENHTVTYSGTPNTGDMNISGLTYTDNDPVAGALPDYYDGWNLVANPYPSAIDWDLIKQGGNLNMIDDGIYVWDGNQYASYAGGISAGSGNLSNLIAPMQAFFVHSTSDNAGINNAGFNLNNSHRAHSSEAYLKNSHKNERENFLRLSLQKGAFTDEAVIYFKEAAQNGFDGAFDAFKLFGTNSQVPHIYSIIDDGNTGLSINALSNLNFEKMRVPLGIKINGSGTYSIRFTEFNFTDKHVCLIDNELDKQIPVSQSTVYEFDFSGGEDKERFEILFYENSAPTLNGNMTAQYIYEDETSRINLPENLFSDADGTEDIQTVSMYLNDNQNLPEWISFDAESMSFTALPENANVASYMFSLEAEDKFGETASTAFFLEVINVNDAPILNTEFENQETDIYTLWQFELPENSFTDLDAGDEISYSLAGNAPEWLYINSENGMLSGTPAESGKFYIEIFASDLQGASASGGFYLKVRNPNTANESEQAATRVFPTVSDAKFTVQSASNNFMFKLSDISGKVLMQKNYTRNLQQVDLSNYAAGSYFIQIESEQEKSKHRIVLKK